MTLASTYRRARARVSHLFSALPTDQLRQPVPATQDWTVHDVLAHLTGGAADAAGDRLDGAGPQGWTQRHVDERRNRTVGELLDEWDEVAPTIHSTLIIRDEHGEQWTCGRGEPTTLLSAKGYELFRATYSRRSKRQIAAWTWTPAPRDALIGRIGFFGSRLDDQPVPATR